MKKGSDAIKIKEVLQEGVDLTKTNVMIIVPSVGASLIVGVLFLIAGIVGKAAVGEMGTATANAMDYAGLAGRSLSGLTLLAVISGIVMLLGHSMTVGMACGLVRNGSSSLKAGYEAAVSRFAPLVVSSLIVGVLVGIGSALLVVPGIILAFMFLFTFVAVMHDDLSAVNAIKKSISIAKNRFGDTFVLFLVLIAIGVLVAIVNMIVNLIPVLGPILSIVLGGVYVGYSSVLLVLAYRILDAPGEATGGSLE